MVILNWNGLRFLGPCLQSLIGQTSSTDEIILVHNGSDDGSAEYVRKYFPTVKVMENGENLGFSEGNNAGLKIAAGKYIVVLNKDTRVPRDFIDVLVKCASADPQIGSVGCRIVQEDGSLSYGPLVTNSGFGASFQRSVLSKLILLASAVMYLSAISVVFLYEPPT